MSELEETFAFHLRAHKVKGFKREVKFHKTRKWRFDFADEERMIAIEIDGGIWRAKGAHNTGKAILRDMEKSNEAQALGWCVFRFDGDQVNDGRAINFIVEVLKTIIRGQ